MNVISIGFVSSQEASSLAFITSCRFGTIDQPNLTYSHQKDTDDVMTKYVVCQRGCFHVFSINMGPKGAHIAKTGWRTVLQELGYGSERRFRLRNMRTHHCLSTALREKNIRLCTRESRHTTSGKINRMASKLGHG